MCDAPYVKRINGAMHFFIRVTPNASKNEVGGIWEGPDGDIRLVVKVTAPPDKGRANAAAIKLLAKHFGVAKSSVEIISGETARLKTVTVFGLSP